MSDNQDELDILASLVGHRITAVGGYEGEPDCGLLGVVITLADGREIDLQGWGHDWWGLRVRRVR